MILHLRQQAHKSYEESFVWEACANQEMEREIDDNKV